MSPRDFFLICFSNAIARLLQVSQHDLGKREPEVTEVKVNEITERNCEKNDVSNRSTDQNKNVLSNFKA